MRLSISTFSNPENIITPLDTTYTKIESPIVSSPKEQIR